jgi:pyruvate kinase
MIKKCHEAGKPVIIVGQLLESMILGLVPSTSEINDISGLVTHTLIFDSLIDFGWR